VLLALTPPLEPFDIAILAFRDPDNVQVELTAPLG
jgi:hypothetical protein